MVRARGNDSAIVNGTKSYTVSDADIQSPNAAVSALKSGGGEGVNKMRANGPACLPPYCRFLFPARAIVNGTKSYTVSDADIQSPRV